MNNPTAYLLAKSLSKRENRQFREQLIKKYAHLRQDIPNLYVLLRSERNPERIKKTLFYEQLYGNQPYHDQQFRKVLSILKKEIEIFLVSCELESNPTKYQELLGQAFLNRGLKKPFYKNLETVNSEQSSNDLSMSDRIMHSYKMQSQRYDFESKFEREKLDYLPEMLQRLNHYYMLEALKWACLIQSHESISSARYIKSEVNSALQFAAQQSMENYPGLRLYYLTYQAGREAASQADFEVLRDTLDVYWQTFSAREIRDIYLLAINHCIRLLNKGSREHLKEAFDLYQSALNKKVLYEHEQLSPFTYKNIMNIALALDKKEWALDFLHQQKNHLDKSIRENTFAANLATYYYKVGQYQEAIELLREVQFLDVFDNLKYRTLLARIYFQLGEHTALEHHLESFASYLYRQKKLGYHKALYQNLIGTMRKILRSNLRDSTVRNRIIQEITNNDQLIEKNWLLSSLQTLHT